MSATTDLKGKRAYTLPVLSSLSGYQASWIRSDISAGLAVAAVGLPSAIAYPAIAGLPPETGIYASILPLAAYAFFGPSRRLIVGPDAATMTVLAAVLAAVLASAPPEAAGQRTAIAAILAIGVGLCCLAARMLKLGVIANFLSRPILTGFFAGISLSILVGQIDRVTGVDVKSDGLVRPVVELLGKFDQIHWPTLFLALSMFALLIVLRARRFPIPGPVVVVVLGVALSAALDFEAKGIAVVGDIPSRLPSLSLPNPTSLPFGTLALGAGAVFLVSFGSGVVTARSFAVTTGEQVDSNRELIGFGAANIAAGVFGAFPVTASDSRTAVNLAVGGQSQVVSLVAAAALVVTILYLGPALRILPIAALGAILAATAVSLIDIAALKQLWHISRMEFVFAIVAMWGPIGLGVLNGVVIAIAATLAYLLHKLMFPPQSSLGRIPGREGFFDLERAPEARPVLGLAMVKFQGSLLFFNSDYVKARLNDVLETLPDDTPLLLIDGSAVPQIDSSAASMLDEVRADFGSRGVSIGLAGLHPGVRDILERAGVIERIGVTMVFDSLEDAIHTLRRSTNI